MGKYSINAYKLDEVCDLLDEYDIPGNVLGETLAGEPFVKIWKGSYERLQESDFCESDILFKIYWWPSSEKYCLHVLDKEYSEQIKSLWQSECWMPNIYLFKTPQAMVDTIKILFSHKENADMNKAIKAEEALNSLIHELTIRKIEWKSLGMIHGYPTIRIYNYNGPDFADIHLLATNSEYVYAIEPATYGFREHLKNNSKYRYARTYPCTNDWYVYITARTVGCVIKDFLEMGKLAGTNADLITYDLITPFIKEKFAIKDVIFNDPATIIIWSDGSKTVVKANGEKFDPEKGLAMAISKKVLGNKHDYYDIFKKHVGRYEKKQKKIKG